MQIWELHTGYCVAAHRFGAVTLRERDIIRVGLSRVSVSEA